MAGYVGRCKEFSVLIETYWNVNVRKAGSVLPVSGVLIETYWNVNKPVSRVFRVTVEVLIETYWNVNELNKLFKEKQAES